MFIELEKGIVNTAHITFFREQKSEDGIEYRLFLVGDEEFIRLTKDDFNRLKQILLKKPRKVTNAEVNTDLQDFFMKLHRLTGGNGTPVFNPAREKKLKELMTKHKLTEEMLVKAATNIGEDPYLQGKDPNNTKRYGDIDYLLRPDKAMKWAEANPISKKRGMFNG